MIIAEVCDGLKKSHFFRSPISATRNRFRLDIASYPDRKKNARVYVFVDDNVEYWDVLDEQKLFGLCSTCLANEYVLQHDSPGTRVFEWTLHSCAIVTQQQMSDVIRGIIKHCAPSGTYELIRKG